MSACIALNIPLENVRKYPLRDIFDLIDKLMPEDQKEPEKTKVTAEMIKQQPKVEYKIWQI